MDISRETTRSDLPEKKARVFVTGGTGKIGRCLVPLLSKRGFSVTVLLRRNTNIFDGLKDVSTITGNITDQSSFSEVLACCDYVIHLAVYQNANDQNIAMFKSVNVDGTTALLKSLEGVNVKKVVNVSSIVVFVNTGKSVRDEKWILRKEYSHDYYAQTKNEALLAVRDAIVNVPVVTVFPTLVVDPSDFSQACPTGHGPLMNFLWKILGGGIPGGLICRIGAGSRIINYVIIDDLVDGLVRAMVNGRGGEEYILGGENVPVRDFLRACERRANKRVLHFRVPFAIVKLVAGFARILPVPGIIRLIAEKGMGDMCFSSRKAEVDFGYRNSLKI